MTKLYIDMDGVVADFNKTAQQALNVSDEELAQAILNHRWSPEQWDQLTKIPNFYRTLPLTGIATRLIELADRFRNELGINTYFLTAIPSGNDMPDCIHDKVLWVGQYFPQMRVRFGPYSKDKSSHCRPGDILIDDRSDLCDDWRAAGGIAINCIGDGEAALAQLQLEFDTRKNSV